MPKLSPTSVDNCNPSQPPLRQIRATPVDGALDGNSISRSATTRGVGKSGNRPSPATDTAAAVPPINGNGSACDDNGKLSSNGHSHIVQHRGDIGENNGLATPNHKSTSGVRTSSARTTTQGNGHVCDDSCAATMSPVAVAAATGISDDEMGADKNNNSVKARDGRSRRRKTHVEELLKAYFPVTLQAAGGDLGETSRRRRRSDTVDVESVRRNSGHRLQSQNEAGGSPRRLRSAGSRQSSTRSSSSSASSSSFDRIYLAAFDDGRIGSSPILQSSPYEEQLSHLRQEMLRIQEERHQQRAEQDRPRGSQQRHGHATPKVGTRRNSQPIAVGSSSSSSSRSTMSALVLDLTGSSDSSPTATLTPARAAEWAAALYQGGQSNGYNHDSQLQVRLSPYLAPNVFVVSSSAMAEARAATCGGGT